MTLKRKFYKTVVTVTVLSEEPLSSDLGLKEIEYQISEGDCSGVVKISPSVVLSAREAAAALIEQGSSPEFFGLDEKGRKL